MPNDLLLLSLIPSVQCSLEAITKKLISVAKARRKFAMHYTKSMHPMTRSSGSLAIVVNRPAYSAWISGIDLTLFGGEHC
jgi:hypothetical protein